MFYPQSGANNLPIVRYAPSPRLPGVSHAAGQSWGRVRLSRRARWAALLLGLVLGLVLMSPLLHHPQPAPARNASPRARIALHAAPTTRPEPRWDTKLDAAPRKGKFVRFFRMKTTAYTPINTRMEGGRYTSTRRDGRTVHGVAVDPDLIPLGSQLWIPGYGHAVADDIGGAIHGHHVDIRVQVYEHMSHWGVRPVRVYVLQEPKS